MVDVASLVVRVGANVREAVDGLSQVDRSFGMTRQEAEKFERDTKRFTLGAVTAVTGVAVGAAKMAIDFESSFAGVRKTVDATEAEYKDLAASFRAMALEVPVSVNELNRIAEAAGQLGVKKEHIVDFTRQVAILSDTTNLMGQDAAMGIARFANVTKMAMEDTSRFAATIVDLGNNSATTEAEILAMALRIAAAGTQIGMSQAEILGYAAALSSVGVEAEAGGSAISRVFIEIDKAVAGGGEMLKFFADVAGMSAKEFAAAWGDDPTSASLQFIRGLDRIKDSGGNVFQILDELGLSNIRVRDSLLRAATAQDLFSEAQRRANSAWEENNAHIEEANKRWETTASRLRIAMNTVMDLAITVGNHLLPAIVAAADYASQNLPRAFEWVNENAVAVEALAGAMWLVVEVAQQVVHGLSENQQIAVPLAQSIGIATVAMVGLGAAMLAIGVMTNPFFAVYVGITALSLAVLIAIDQWQLLRERYEAVDRASRGAAEGVRLFLEGVSIWAGWIDSAIRGFDDFIAFLVDLPGKMWDAGVEGAKAFARGVEHGAVDIARAAAAWLDPRNWDIPGGSPLMHAMDHFGNEAGNRFTAGMAAGIEAGAPAVEGRVQTLAARVRRYMDEMFGWLFNTTAFVGPLVETDLYYKGDPKEGPMLGKSAADIAYLNQKAVRDRMSPFSSFGSLGAGGGAGEAAKSAAEEFAAAWEAELRSGALAEVFGQTGSALLMSFADALESPATAARLPDIINRLVAEAKEEGVPNAQELGNELAAAIARGLETGSDADIQAALGQLTAAVAQAGKLTVDTFAKAVGASAADSKLTSQIGSAGKSIMDALNRAIDEGGKTNIARLADIVNRQVDTLASKAPEGQAAFLGSSMMDALNRAIELRTPETIASLTSVLEQVNTVLMGGAIDIRTGTTIAAEAVKALADTFSVNSGVIVQHIGVIVQSGILNMLGALDQLPAKAHEAITALLRTLAAGKGDIDDIADQIARNLPGYMGPGKGASGDTSQGVPGENWYEFVARVTGIDFSDPDQTGMLLYANGRHVGMADIIRMGQAEFLSQWSYGGITPGTVTGAYQTDPNANPLGTMAWPGSPGYIPGHKDGLDYVPYDNYLARLHKGERVVPAAANHVESVEPWAAGTHEGRILAHITLTMDGRVISEKVEEVLVEQMTTGAQQWGVP